MASIYLYDFSQNFTCHINIFILMQSIFCGNQYYSSIIFHVHSGQFEVSYCTTNITNLAKPVDCYRYQWTVNLSSVSERRAVMFLNGWVCIHWTEIGKLDPREQPNVYIIWHRHACRAQPSRSNTPLRLQSCYECRSRQARSESRTSVLMKK